MKRRFFIKPIIIISYYIMLTLICEIILRIFAPAWLDHRMKEVDAAGYPLFHGSDANIPMRKIGEKIISYAPNIKFTIAAGEYKNIVNIDNLGSRAVPNSKRSNSAPVIPFLGDSFVFGLGVNDDETYINLLNAEADYNYLNLGLVGSCLTDQLDIIKARHNELNSPPLYVINFFIGNDLIDIMHRHVEKKNIKTTTIRIEALKLKLEEFLRHINVSVYNNKRLKGLYSIQFMKHKVLNMYNHSVSERRVDPIFNTIDRRYASEYIEYLDLELERLLQLSQRLNFKVIFIIIPDRHQVYPNLLDLKCKYYNIDAGNLDSDLPNEILKAKLQEKGIYFIDVLGYIKYMKQNIYYISDGHFTAEGHRIIANHIGPQLNLLIAKAMKNL